MNDFYKINVTALENSLNSLKIAQEEYLKEKNEFVRDSVIQRFEYAYALTVKILSFRIYFGIYKFI